MEGIHEANLARWFGDHVPGATPPLRFSLIPGGRSNLSFRVADAASSEFVLRRPPVSHVLPTAHDMAREYRIISALAQSPVPVPPALGLCDDPSVTGAPFYVMGYVEGYVLRDEVVAASALDRAARRAAGESLVDVLVDLHGVDIDAVGLSGLARRDGYVGRQLRRWGAQFEQSEELGGRRIAVVDEVRRSLADRIPPEGQPGVVHGDYRLDNVVVSNEGRVRAVLDWELSTLGDPLADLGLLLVYWAEEGDEHPALPDAPTAIAGFPGRRELVGRYASGSGRDLTNLPFYVAFGYWKLACILGGVHARYAAGAGGGDPASAAELADQVVYLAETSRDLIAQL